MEFYDDSPATKLFTSAAIVLSGSREQDAVSREWTFTEKIFYFNYDFADKSISISIFDDTSRSYILGPINATDYQQAEAVLREIESEYPKKISSKDYLAIWKTFFIAMDKTIWVEGDVTDDRGLDGGICEQCGDMNVDRFIFLYVPAVPGSKLPESSLCLHWEFGCYGGTKFTGTYDETIDDVRSLLNQVKLKTFGVDKRNVKKALAVLETAS